VDVLAPTAMNMANTDPDPGTRAARRVAGQAVERRTPPTGIGWVPGSLWQHRELIAQMARREVAGRYRGSVAGLAWSFFNPLLMLGVYTFVFSVVFQVRWDTAPASRADFAMVIFAG